MTAPRVGIDIGGTKVAVGIVAVSSTDNGRAQAARRFFTDPAISGEALVERTLDEVERACASTACPLGQTEGVGISFPGDFAGDGRILTAPNVPAFIGRRPAALFRRALRRRGFDAAVVAANDTCAAILAEARFGAGRGAEKLLYLTVSTGVGGARLVDGRPVNLEPGLRTFPDPELSGRCLEDLAGGAALAREATRQRGRATTARDLAFAMERGDRAARALLRASARWVATSLAGLLADGGDERVVIGGSIALYTPGYLDWVREALAAQVVPSRSDFDVTTDLLPAALGDDVGIVGAALL